MPHSNACLGLLSSPLWGRWLGGLVAVLLLCLSWSDVAVAASLRQFTPQGQIDQHLAGAAMAVIAVQ